MKAVYYDEPNCYVCPAHNDGDVSLCQECMKQSHISVDILRVGVGLFGNKATVLMPGGILKTVLQSKLTLIGRDEVESLNGMEEIEWRNKNSNNG